MDNWSTVRDFVRTCGRILCKLRFIIKIFSLKASEVNFMQLKSFGKNMLKELKISKAILNQDFETLMKIWW